MRRYSIDLRRVFVNICIILAMFAIFNFITNYAFGNRHIETKEVAVKSNDTLWKLASDVCNNSAKELNVQNVIIEIKNINNLKSSNVYEGQVLQIPIYD